MSVTPESGSTEIDERHRVEHPGTWLRLSCCEGSVHPVRILSQSDGLVVISAPTEPHPQWIKTPEPNQAVTLGWSDTGGTLVLECVVPADAVIDGTWSLRILSTQDFLQRRRHIRVSTDDTTVQLMDGDLSRVVTGRVLDMSESGMRCSFGDDFIPIAGIGSKPYQFALHLDDVSVVVNAVVSWAGRTGPLEMQAGFEFIDAYDSLLTRLRAFVMKQLDARGPFED